MSKLDIVIVINHLLIVKLDEQPGFLLFPGLLQQFHFSQ